MARQQRITISQIAKKAGVTGVTVSRALRDSSMVKPATRRLIRNIAQELGYRNCMETRMKLLTAGPKSNQVASWGFVAFSIKNSAVPILVASMISQAQRRNIQLLPCYMENHGKQDNEKIVSMIESGLDGLLVFPTQAGMIDAATLHKIQDSDIPTVSLMNILEGIDCPLVTVDFEKVGQLSAEHLISRGRRNLGFITGRWWYASKLRFAGFKEAVLKADLSLPSSRVKIAYESDWLNREIHSRFQELELEYKESVRTFLDACPELDGVDCGYDVRAIQFVDVCRERGRRVPQDIAVVGCNNTRMGVEHSVSITTFDLRVERAAEYAAVLLDRMTSGEQLTRDDSVLIEPELIARKSTVDGS